MPGSIARTKATAIRIEDPHVVRDGPAELAGHGVRTRGLVRVLAGKAGACRSV